MTYTDLRMMFNKLSQSDCGDNSCAYAGKMKGGMRTNGGCRCADKYIYEILNAMLADRKAVLERVRRPLADIKHEDQTRTDGWVTDYQLWQAVDKALDEIDRAIDKP